MEQNTSMKMLIGFVGFTGTMIFSALNKWNIWFFITFSLTDLIITLSLLMMSFIGIVSFILIVQSTLEAYRELKRRRTADIAAD